MSGKPFVSATATTAAEICTRFNVKKEALALLREGMAPEEFAAALVANKHYVTGIEFMAYTMSPRESVWWGCLCVQHVYGDAISPVEKEAVARRRSVGGTTDRMESRGGAGTVANGGPGQCRRRVGDGCLSNGKHRSTQHAAHASAAVRLRPVSGRGHQARLHQG